MRVALVVIVLGSIGFGVYRGAAWFRADIVGAKVAAAAPAKLDEARRLLADDRYDEARGTLEPIARRKEHPDTAVEAMLILAEVDSREGNDDAAVATLREAAHDFPTSRHRAEAKLRYAQKLEVVGRRSDAFELYEELRDTAPPALRAPAVLAIAKESLRTGAVDEARASLLQVLDDAEWGGKTWDTAMDEMGALNVATFFSTNRAEGNEYYTVEPGDNLTAIGLKLNTTQGQLLRSNGLEEGATLRVDQKLKYTPIDFRIIIDRSACRLYVLDGDAIFKMYRIGLGKEGHETALGNYRIGNKQKNPAWFKPGEGEIPFGDPRNELGTRWMPMVPREEGLPTDLGIHGTIAPETVGTYSSSGCARLVNEEVEELYDLAVRSTPVDVVESVNRSMLVGET